MRPSHPARVASLAADRPGTFGPISFEGSTSTFAGGSSAERASCGAATPLADRCGLGLALSAAFPRSRRPIAACAGDPSRRGSPAPQKLSDGRLHRPPLFGFGSVNTLTSGSVRAQATTTMPGTFDLPHTIEVKGYAEFGAIVAVPQLDRVQVDAELREITEFELAVRRDLRARRDLLTARMLELELEAA